MCSSQTSRVSVSFSFLADYSAITEELKMEEVSLNGRLISARCCFSSLGESEIVLQYADGMVATVSESIGE